MDMWRDTARDSNIFGIHASALVPLLIWLASPFKSTLFTVLMLGLSFIIIVLSIMGKQKGINIFTYLRLFRHKLGRFFSHGGRMYRGFKVLRENRRINNL